MGDKKTMEQRLVEAFEDSMVAAVRNGLFTVAPDYTRRTIVDPAILTEIYAKVDRARVVALVVEKAEERMADNIYNAMSHELSTDVKKILSNTELREDLRAILRAKIREAAAALGNVRGV